MIGKTISHYKILEKLGEGGMGVVYKAEDTKLDRTVALKFLTQQALGGEEDRARFVHEAKSAAALPHPNICTVHEIDEAEGRTFIAMEYVEGKSLKEEIESGPLKLDEAVDIATQVAEGLQEAHEKGIVHRDIKPANIMVTPRGQAKIMDFGLAKAPGRTKLTKMGMTLGTAAYMTPEQARGEEVDSRSDIWSLGAILYEMVAGQRAFKGDYEPAILYSILNQTQEPLTALRTGVPMELERIVNKCLSKDKSERYQTAADLVADLKHLMRTLDGARVESRMGPPTVSEQKSLRPWLWAVGVVAIVIIAVFAARHYLGPSGGVGEGPTTSEGSSERKMLVVLPFENLGAPEDEYFADGITEELTSRLAALQGLGVISRTSAFQYKGAGKTIKQIGEELGVGYVLEGTVRWDRVPGGGSRVRVTPQLIRVSDDTHLWSERYDRELQDIFAVQSQIAEQVIDQLDVALMGAQRKTLEDRPTDNMEAYQAYLRGMEHINVPDVPHESALAALAMFKRAVELDPEFALAYTNLSWVHSRMYQTYQDRSDACLANAKAAVDEALRLQPELPEARAVLGMYFYWGLRDYDRALGELAVAEQGLPNSAEIIQAVGYIHRRQGKFESALEKIKEAFELNPQDADLAMEVASTYAALRRHGDAIEYCDRAIFIHPDYAGAHAWKAVYLMHGFGDLEGSRAVLEGIPATTDMIGSLAWLLQFAYERNFEALLVGVQSIPVEYVDTGVLAHSKSLLLGMLYDWGLEQPEVARPYFETAQALLEQRVAEMPEDHRIRSLLGVAYAGLGRKDDAIREGKKAVELCPLTKDALDGPNRLRDLAEIYAAVGEHDAALDILEQLLEIPAGRTVSSLRLSYSWDSLREHPRFQQLLEKYSESGP